MLTSFVPVKLSVSPVYPMVSASTLTPHTKIQHGHDRHDTLPQWDDSVLIHNNENNFDSIFKQCIPLLFVSGNFSNESRALLALMN